MKIILKEMAFWLKATLIISTLLVIAGFIVPPTGVIDPSVLAGIGELGLMASIFAIILNLPEYISAGAKAKLTYGKMNFELNASDELSKKENEDDETIQEID